MPGNFIRDLPSKVSIIDMSTTQNRPALRHPRPAHPEDPRHHGGDARLQHRPAHRAGVGEPHATEPGLGLSGPHPPRAGGLDPHRVGRLGDEPQGEVLRPDQGRERSSSRSKWRTGKEPRRSWPGSWRPSRDTSLARAAPARPRPEPPPRPRTGRRSAGASGAGGEGRAGRRAVAGGRAPGGAPQFWRPRADEGSASRRAQRPLARHAAEGRPLRTPAAGAGSRLCGRRRQRDGDRHRRQHRDVQPGGRGPPEAASLLRPRAHRPGDGGADPDDPQRDCDPQFRRLEAAEHVVRGAVGDARAQRRADRSGRAGPTRRRCSCRPTTSRSSASRRSSDAPSAPGRTTSRARRRSSC